MALTTIPAAGAKLRGSVLSALITEVRPLWVRAASDQALTASSTTLQDLTELVLTIPANTTYSVNLLLAWTLATGTTEDIRVGATWPTGATVDFGGAGPATTLGAATGVGDGQFVRRVAATSGTTVINFGASTNMVNAILDFVIINGANAGTLQIQAAQDVSGVNVTTVKAGSYLLATRLA